MLITRISQLWTEGWKFVTVQTSLFHISSSRSRNSPIKIDKIIDINSGNERYSFNNLKKNANQLSDQMLLQKIVHFLWNNERGTIISSLPEFTLSTWIFWITVGVSYCCFSTPYSHAKYHNQQLLMILPAPSHAYSINCREPPTITIHPN